MPEYVCTFDNRQGSEYESDNKQREVTVQVYGYLLRDRRIQKQVKDLRVNALGKKIWFLTIFSKNYILNL